MVLDMSRLCMSCQQLSCVSCVPISAHHPVGKGGKGGGGVCLSCRSSAEFAQADKPVHADLADEATQALTLESERQLLTSLAMHGPKHKRRRCPMCRETRCQLPVLPAGGLRVRMRFLPRKGIRFKPAHERPVCCCSCIGVLQLAGSIVRPLTGCAGFTRSAALSF